MNWKRWFFRSIFWLLIAMVVTWPASMNPASVLIGHPDVDVWNHAWGYWFVPHEIANFRLPFSPELSELRMVEPYILSICWER